jgi:hypothetical protein
MAELIIAIIFDCDDTLCPDTISFVLNKYSVDPTQFWKEVDARVKDGWDPPQAYMHRILAHVQRGEIKKLTRRKLRNIGKDMPVFAGIPKVFEELKQFVSSNKDLKQARISLEFYIISGGLEEMVCGSRLRKHMNGIVGCNFVHDAKTGLPIAVKSTVSFTEKTRFVFAINKGISLEEARTNPYLVNDSIDESDRRIPFKNMIYIGDGPSDIPCLSLITKKGGEGIGVSPPAQTFKKGYEMARGERITVGPYTADYRKGTDMRKVLEQIILTKGLEIALETRKRVVTAPQHE